MFWILFHLTAPAHETNPTPLQVKMDSILLKKFFYWLSCETHTWLPHLRRFETQLEYILP